MKRVLPILLTALLALALMAPAACAEVPCSYYSAHGDHNWVQINVTMPTCTQNGYIYLECATCGTQDTLVNYAYGHDWEQTDMKSPSCQETGWIKETCNNCHETRTYELPKLDHVWTHVGYDTPSTCTEKGWRMEECLNCGQIRTSELPLADHSYGPWHVVQPATDSTAGIRARVCAVCGVQDSVVYYVDGTLYRGGPSGAAVAELQQMLIDLHFLIDKADGSFGKKTEQAVKDYQASVNLPVTGIAFPQTIAYLSDDWEIAMGYAGDGPEAVDPDSLPPFCVREAAENSEDVRFCAKHAALVEQELQLRMDAASEAETVEALRACVSLWLEEIDNLYFQWNQQLPEADKPLALAARNAFSAMLTAQEAALTAIYGEDSAQALYVELDLLHERVTVLCGILNMTGE